MSSTYSVPDNENERKPVLTRREFALAALAGLMTLPAIARFLAVIGRYTSVPERNFSGSVMPTWVPGGLERDLAQVPRGINFGDDMVYVWKGTNGKIFAFSGTCPHAGCLVSFKPEKNVFECPCHGGQFNLEGNVVGGPPPRGMFPHNVKVSLGRIMVGRRIES